MYLQIFNLMNAEFLFYLARGYIQRRQSFHSSISSLNLNLNSKTQVWAWIMELCLPNNRINNRIPIALTIGSSLTQSYNRYSICNYTIHIMLTINIIHTNANHTICRNHAQPFILTTHLSNLKRLKKLLLKGSSFRYAKLYLRDTNIFYFKREYKDHDATRTNKLE